jgi:hypothetical protein
MSRVLPVSIAEGAHTASAKEVEVKMRHQLSWIRTVVAHQAIRLLGDGCFSGKSVCHCH